MKQEKTMKPGEKITVRCALDESSRSLLHQQVTFLRFSKPHGFTVCEAADGQVWHLHPECFESNDRRGGHDCDPHEMINGACGICHERENR